MSDPLNPMGMQVVITGNPIDGFEVYGPFKVPSEADAWGIDNCMGEWWKMPLKSPEELPDGS